MSDNASRHGDVRRGTPAELSRRDRGATGTPASFSRRNQDVAGASRQTRVPAGIPAGTSRHVRRPIGTPTGSSRRNVCSRHACRAPHRRTPRLAAENARHGASRSRIGPFIRFASSRSTPALSSKHTPSPNDGRVLSTLLRALLRTAATSWTWRACAGRQGGMSFGL